MPKNMPPKTPAKKTDEEQESDVEVIPNLRKSARIASKSEHRDARGESVSSITASESSVVTPARAAGKKRGSVEPEASAPVTPSRRTSARLSSMSEHNENGDKPLELPTPRKRTSSTSSMGSTTTPRRMTRAASKTMPTLLENEEDVPKTPPQEEISKALLPEVPQSAQKRHANLASKLIKMLDTPQKTKKPMLDIAEEEEVIVLPAETKKDETPSKISPKEESPSKTTKKDSPKKESPKKEQESPKKEQESPKKEKESPKKETPTKVCEISKKESAKKETPKKETPKSKKKKDDDEESEDEAMDWEEGPIKTPVVFHPTVLPMSKKRLQQLLPEQTETPTTRAARRGRPSSSVIFGEEIEKKEDDEEVVDLTDSPVREKSTVVTAERVEKVSPVKKAVSPTKSPVKVVEEDKEDEEDEEMGSDDVFLPESPAKKTTVSPVKEKVPTPVKKAASPKKAVKAVEVDDDKEEEDVEQEDEEEASDEKEEDVGEDDEEEEEEEEEQKEVTKSPKKKLVVEEEKEKKEEDMDDEDEEVEDEDVNDEDEDEEEEDEDEAVDGIFPAVSFNKVYNGSVDFSAALESVYAWAFARGSSRVDDLPGKLVAAGEAETVWQQIDHRNAQITKDCKKAKKAGLLEKDIELAEEEKQSGKKAKGKKRRAVEEEEQEEEDEAMFDDEDLLMDEDEEEEGEDVDDEDEEEGNLFDMTADELARLDEDLKALEAEDGEEEEEEEERPKKKKKKTAEGEKKKKFPKSSVDDRFFSLAEMEAAADALEKDGAIEEGILDDDEEGDAAYTYDEFFGGANDDDVFGGKKEKKKGKKTGKRDDEEEEDDVIGKKASSKGEKRKSVSWAEGDKLKEERLIEPTGKMRRLTAAALNGEEEDEEEQQAKEKPEEEEERILLGPAEDEDKEGKTQLKVSIKSIKKRIAQLEEENLEARKWDLQGEVGGSQRGENTLLEQHVEFDHGMTRAPTITEDFNAKIEAIVLQRFKDKAWDDPVRTVRQEERTDEYRNKLVDEDLLIKQSLSSVYEKEYEKAQEGGDASAAGKTIVDPKHAEIDGMWTELCGLIDPLFHFNVTPQQAKAEVKVLTNVRALQSEEVGAMMSTEEMLIAPEEVKRREKGALKGKEERDSTDKKRERRKKKQKQRAVVLTRGEDGLKRMLEKKAEGETDENGEPKKKKKKKAGDGASAASAAGKSSGGKFKSTDFFTKLQTTVQNELVEKTKKTKVKAVSKGNSSAKFKL